ncbi:conjugative transposon protein TraM [Sphingobacterium sp.]|uniref:conjugative transposon protein TraM n=1 Tax=Sphingobacterium sp. TaxID=341027 RepID=UPI00258A62C2|nr:conjugative transposon protein TraM [Sphingobacterium sp.]WET69069.1 MAG: conjugative transposon protein TraM [Sphingobacterium sp.]
MSENKKQVQIKEGAISEIDTSDTNKKGLKEKLKKPVIFALMGIAFLGCMFLIFKPSGKDKQKEQIGLNDAVPGASEAGLQSDKQKAYEQELMEQKELEKRQSLMSLSDYWNQEISSSKDESSDMASEDSMYSNDPANASLNSYRSAQNTLGNFYQPDNSYETQQLKKEIEELRSELSDKESQPQNPVESQLALMEKSYEMAAKYLPTGAQNQTSEKILQTATNMQKKEFVSFVPERKQRVSALYRESSDSAFLENVNSERNRGFYTAGISEQTIQPKNSIRAMIQQTQTVTSESTVQIRLLENAETPDCTIPKGTVLTAVSKFQGNRLQLLISSIEHNGNILPVDLSVYDVDGQMGLQVPYSPEINALTEMAGNMSQQSGTSLMMTSSAGQQIAADLSRGVVQGISGYFSKKVRTPKVTVKAGHQLFLVSKK